MNLPAFLRAGVNHWETSWDGSRRYKTVRDGGNRLIFPVPHGWQDAMYESYVTRAGKPADLLKAEKDPVVIDGLRRAISSFENTNI